MTDVFFFLILLRLVRLLEEFWWSIIIINSYWHFTSSSLLFNKLLLLWFNMRRPILFKNIWLNALVYFKSVRSDNLHCFETEFGPVYYRLQHKLLLCAKAHRFLICRSCNTDMKRRLINFFAILNIEWHDLYVCWLCSFSLNTKRMDNLFKTWLRLPGNFTDWEKHEEWNVTLNAPQNEMIPQWWITLNTGRCQFWKENTNYFIKIHV